MRCELLAKKFEEDIALKTLAWERGWLVLNFRVALARYSFAVLQPTVFQYALV